MPTATTVPVKMAQRRDTAASWTSVNPTLLAGEIGIESDTGYWKVGDGTTAWNSLVYLSGLGGEIPVSRLADGTARQLLQTAANGTDVEWTSNIDVPGTLDVTGAATFDAAVTISGDLTVNGTTTNINTTNLVVEDKNIIVGDVATPTDVTADGGGITLKGTTDKTINWIDATDAWTFSEHVNIASAKEYRIAGTKVLDATSLGGGVVSSSLTSVGTIGTGTWQGSTVGVAYGGTGQTSYTDGQLLIGNTTGNTLTKATLTAGSGVSITNGSGSITIAATGDVTLAANNAFTGANTFTNSTGQIFRQASTQDGVLLRGRAGGSSSYNVELVPTTLTASRTLTLPNVSDTVAVLGTAQTFTAVQTLTDPAIIGTILEDVFTITDGAAFEVDPGNGSVQLITLGASRTPKATNFAAGESVTLMVDDGTAYTLTWTDSTWGTGGVTWVGGTAPTLATSGYTVIQFWKVGTKVYGARVGDVA